MSQPGQELFVPGGVLVGVYFCTRFFKPCTLIYLCLVKKRLFIVKLKSLYKTHHRWVYFQTTSSQTYMRVTSIASSRLPTRSSAYRLVKGGWGLQLLPQMLPYSSLLYQEPRRGRQVYRLVKGGQGLLQSTLAGILQGRAWGQCLLKVSLLTLLVLRTRSFLNFGFYSKHYIHVMSTPFILAPYT